MRERETGVVARRVVAAARPRLVKWWTAPINLWTLWRARDHLATRRGASAH